MQKLCCSLLFIISICGFSQNLPFDTLKQKLNAPDDSTKLKTLTLLTYRYVEYDTDSALAYADKAIALAAKLNKEERQLLLTVTKAEVFNFKATFDSSRKYLLLVSSRVSDTKYPKVKGFMLMTWSDVFNQAGQYDSAISKLYTALRIYETLNDSLRQAQIYSSLGRNYLALRDHSKAKEVYRSSLRIAGKLHNVNMLSEANINLGSVYMRTKQSDSALYFFRKAEKISLDNPHLEARLVTLYDHIGSILGEKGNTAAALDYFKKSLEAAKKFNRAGFIALENASIAREYIKSRNFAQAHKYLKEAEVALTSDADVLISEYVYQVYAAYHFAKGNFEEGEKYFSKYSSLLDSTLNTSKTQAVAEMEVKYETAKKDKELLQQKLDIAEKNKDILAQRTLLYSLLGFIAIATLITVLLYNRYRLRQQAKLDAAIIKEQKLGLKAIIEAQDKERDRLSKELHDGVLQQLVAVKAGLHMLENRNNIGEGKIKKDLYDVLKTLDDAVTDLRNISHLMMPRALKEKGLPTALEQLSATVFKQAGINCSFFNNGFSIRLNEQKEFNLYRIAQEIFANILKHARATAVNIKLSNTGNKLTLEIADNGIGFNEQEAREKGGAGLFNIYSRISNLNGNFYAEPNSSGGSRFIVQCPI